MLVSHWTVEHGSDARVPDTQRSEGKLTVALIPRMKRTASGFILTRLHFEKSPPAWKNLFRLLKNAVQGITLVPMVSPARLYKIHASAKLRQFFVFLLLSGYI